MMKRMLARVMAGVVLGLLLGVQAQAAVFQYAVPVTWESTDKDGKVKVNESTAFLWVPAESKQVRGVLMAGMTLMEQQMSKDPVLRKACAEQDLAIVFMKCGLGAPDLQKVLKDLAKASGYGELSVAPLAFVGHSAGGPQAQAMSAKYAERCFALMQFRGGGPFNGNPPTPAGIPTLMMVGQFDEYGGTMRNAEGKETWERGMLDAMKKHRAGNEGRLSSLVIEPGAGHFAWSDREAAYFSMFLKKAAAARIPASWPVDSKTPPELKTVDPKSGWLSDLDAIKKPSGVAAAAYGEYKGDKATAQWHFDKEMAEATVKRHAEIGKKDQFITWKDPFWVDAGTRFFFTKLEWVDDGDTLQTHPVFATTYPERHNNQGPIWPAGEVGHVKDGKIKVRPVSGPLVAVGDHKLLVEFDALSPANEGVRSTFLAYNEGDEEYRYTERVGMFPRGFNGLGGGKAQTITFEPVGNLKVGGAPVELKATSDSGLKVKFYVAKGPAVVEDGKLKISELPARATFPIEVTVVAYQFGSGKEPQVKTAKAVEQTVKIEK